MIYGHAQEDNLENKLPARMRQDAQQVIRALVWPKAIRGTRSDLCCTLIYVSLEEYLNSKGYSYVKKRRNYCSTPT